MPQPSRTKIHLIIVTYLKFHSNFPGANELIKDLFLLQKEEVENKVLLPLNQLLAMFQGPNKVIKKRHDKLLDYDNLASKVQGYRNEAQIKAVSESIFHA